MRTFVCLIVFMISSVGCGGKAELPRVTTVPVTGYPYPFGIEVKRLLGRASWQAAVLPCNTHFMKHTLQPSPRESSWSSYSQVVLTADSLGTLQGFLASRDFSTDTEAKAHLSELVEEIRRRYGTQTDSLVEGEKIVVEREWQDASGNAIGVENRGTNVRVTARSARLERDCPGVTKEMTPRAGG